MSETLTSALVELANARADLYAVEETMRAARARFDAEHAELIDQGAALRSAVSIADARAKLAAKITYLSTGERTPAPGVAIKLFSTMTYGQPEALAWAREKGMALQPESLDVKAFEKIAGATPLAFVTYAQEPRVQIASQLNAADYATALAPAPLVIAGAIDEDPFA